MRLLFYKLFEIINLNLTTQLIYASSTFYFFFFFLPTRRYLSFITLIYYRIQYKMVQYAQPKMYVFNTI